MPEPSPLGLAYPHEVRRPDENALADELASSGYLRAYVGWASDQTDAPRLFHVGAGLLGLATSLGNRVWCHSWGNDIYPNLWLCLLAPSGFYRKSTSIGYTAKILKQIDPGMLMPRDFSREKLVMSLGERSDVLLVASEFGELLAKLSRDYMVGCKEMLTSLYDGEDYERKTQKESAVIRTPAISILTASTEDWIGNRVTQGDLRGGFLSRFLFLPARTKSNPKGISEGVNHEMRDELVTALRARSKTSGIVDFKPVKPLLDHWIGEFEAEVNAAPDPRMMGFFSRAGLCILKLAMCFQASEWPMSLTISEPCAQKAIRMWEFLAENIREVITEQITTTRVEAQIKAVLEIVKGSGGTVEYTPLLRQSRMLTRDLDNIVQTLVKSGQLEDVVQKTRGRPQRKLRLTSKLSSLTSQTSQEESGPGPLELPKRNGLSSLTSQTAREESLAKSGPGEGQ